MTFGGADMSGLAVLMSPAAAPGGPTAAFAAESKVNAHAPAES